jgi:hypothetical protein
LRLTTAVLRRDNAPELRLVREWLNSWSGLELIVAGMTHQGWDVQLTAYAARDWRANFFPVGIAHSIVGGTALDQCRGGRCSGRRAPSVHGATRSPRRCMSWLYLLADCDQRPSQRAAADRRRPCRDGVGDSDLLMVQSWSRS